MKKNYKDLIEDLKRCSCKKDYQKSCHNLKNYDLSGLRKFVSFEEDCYARNTIYKDEDFELVLLCWSPGQLTPIHSHGGSECWMYILKGELSEQQYEIKQNRLKKTNSKKLSIGVHAHINDNIAYHTLGNIESRTAISLHLYAKPITKYQCFDEKTNSFNWISHEKKGVKLNAI